MNIAARLKICKTCQNKDFDPKRGIVCGLTNEKPVFEINCADYKPDQSSLLREERKEEFYQSDPELRADANFEKRVAKSLGSEATNAIRQEEQDFVKNIRQGANWFYWIAGLSVINSILLYSEADLYFIFGLGATLLVDGIVYEITGSFNIYGFIINVIITAVFASFGYFANRLLRKPFLAGMILYLMDALLFLIFQEWLSLGFHAFALFMMYRGYRNLGLLHKYQSNNKE